MKKLFDMDNPVMRALSVAADLLILNILTVICSLPIITMGAAFTAMNDVCIRIVRGEEGYIFKGFFRSFASNFKKGTLLGLVLIACALFLYYDYFAALTYIPQMRFGILAMAVILFAVCQYAFALLARYENTFGAMLKNAAALTVGYFPRTLIMVVFAVALWLLSLRFPQVGGPVLIMFGFSVPCYINALLLKGVFNKLDES